MELSDPETPRRHSAARAVEILERLLERPDDEHLFLKRVAAVEDRLGERRQPPPRSERPAFAAPSRFDAFLELAYLSDYWQQPKARIFNRDPFGAREKVEQDIEKIAANLGAGACRLGM